MEDIDDDSGSSTIEPADVQQNNQSHDVDQNLRTEGHLEAESNMESFRSGSSSAVYQSNQQQDLVENLTRNIRSYDQNNIEPLVTLVKEQSAEIDNLKHMNSDLTAANADLRTQINQKIATCEQDLEKRAAENAVMQRKLNKLETANAELQAQVAERKETCKDKMKLLSDAEQEIQKLAVENAEIKKELKFFKTLSVDSANSNTELRYQLNEKHEALQARAEQLSDAELKILQLSEENSEYRKTIDKLSTTDYLLQISI